MCQQLTRSTLGELKGSNLCQNKGIPTVVPTADMIDKQCKGNSFVKKSRNSLPFTVSTS